MQKGKSHCIKVKMWRCSEWYYLKINILRKARPTLSWSLPMMRAYCRLGLGEWGTSAFCQPSSEVVGAEERAHKRGSPSPAMAQPTLNAYPQQFWTPTTALYTYHSTASIASIFLAIPLRHWSTRTSNQIFSSPFYGRHFFKWILFKSRDPCNTTMQSDFP